MQPRETRPDRGEPADAADPFEALGIAPVAMAAIVPSFFTPVLKRISTG